MHKPACSKEIEEVIEENCKFLKPGNFKTLEPAPFIIKKLLTSITEDQINESNSLKLSRLTKE